MQWLFLNDENILVFVAPLISIAAVFDPDLVMAVVAAEVEARREGEEGGEEERMKESMLFSVKEEEEEDDDESMAKAQMRGSVRRTTSHQLLRTAVSILDIFLGLLEGERGEGGGIYGGKKVCRMRLC